ncbi:O-antigen ligase family protein [Fictibacillus nanhaiensis]|uniref:O-antigen ligase family protein n=1 Tax=Fictibacillus nanhaiensis TaxID=742169 RepID=A0ABS2ZMA7_9BACL|nr:O-antigen ligase family protein [Fictibacillus nanhaiensis]
MTTIYLDKNSYFKNLDNIGKTRYCKKIGFSTLLFGIYTTLIPLDQVMNFNGSGTINRYLGIMVMISILFGLLINKKKFVLKREYIPVLLLVFVGLSSYFWSINQSTTLTTIIRFLSLVSFYIVCTNRLYTNIEKAFIKFCIVLGGVIVAIYLINTSDTFNNRVFIVTNSGEAADPNSISSTLAICMIVLLDYLLRTKKRKIILLVIISMLIVLYAMLLTGSRGGMIGLIIGSLIYLILTFRIVEISKKRVFIVCSIIFISLFTVLGSGLLTKHINVEVIERMTLASAVETGGTGRFSIWQNALIQIYEKLFIGYGFGTGPNVLEHYYGTYIGMHNDSISILIGTGVIGFFLFLLFIIKNIRKCFVKKDVLTLTLLIMVLISGLTLDYILHKNFWNVMIYSQIGLGLVSSIPNRSV